MDDSSFPIMAIEAMEVGWGLRERISLILVGVLEPLEAIVKVLQTLQLGYSPSTLYFPSGATCYDNTAANCRGTEIPRFNTTRDCCLGDGFWVIQPNGECVQCIGKYIVIVVDIVLKQSSLAVMPLNFTTSDSPVLTPCLLVKNQYIFGQQT